MLSRAALPHAPLQRGRCNWEEKTQTSHKGFLGQKKEERTRVSAQSRETPGPKVTLTPNRYWNAALQGSPERIPDLPYPSQPLRTQVRKTTAISAAGTDKRVNKGSRNNQNPDRYWLTQRKENCARAGSACRCVMDGVTRALLLLLAGLPVLEANDVIDKDSPFYYGGKCKCKNKQKHGLCQYLLSTGLVS
ncbi:hypothetical protein MJG53_019256 [Ovis ammon polii x Ovis aries]|uniref:Uncharacterized protein n=1 Tax=Ovis ammon polii x Ovis aries TaxID=2918886 RepID=A0ACB9U2Y0_9CETA|nr:hypothetical protein MJG53_019256 [Ovis ammon polii x Ovis aries]